MLICDFGNCRMQSQLVCNGCRNVLLYPRGATNVCCAICNTITPVPPPGMCIYVYIYIFFPKYLVTMTIRVLGALPLHDKLCLHNNFVGKENMYLIVLRKRTTVFPYVTNFFFLILLYVVLDAL